MFENKITEIKNIDNLVNLQKLDMWSNMITEIKNIDNLSNLQKLCLYTNKIKNIDNMSNLQKLYLDNNYITEIPLIILNNTNLLVFYHDVIIINPIITRFLYINAMRIIWNENVEPDS